MISERSLARVCRPAILGRGRIIAGREGKIWGRSCQYEGTVTHLRAQVGSSSGSGESYRVAVSVDEVADSVVSHSCTCPAARRFPGPCKHAAAVVLDFNRDANAYSGWDELEHVSTTSVVADYLSRIVPAPPAPDLPSHETPASVRLVPTLVRDHDLFVQLRVAGARGSYVVRDFGDFATRVMEGAWHEYGKKLAFAHTLAAFDPWSRDVASFVVRCVQNRRSHGAERLFGRTYGGVTPLSLGRELRLSGPETDEFLELCLGREVRFECPHADMSALVTVVDDNPSVDLRIEVTGEGDFELARGAEMEFFSTATRAYAVQGGRLCRCGREFLMAAPFFSGVYCSAVPRLLLASSDAARFAATALPTIEAAMPVMVPAQLEALRPVACKLEFYLDRNGSTITCDVQAVYGERRYHVLTRLAGSGIDYGRDVAAEAAARALVGRYFPRTHNGIATLSVRDDDAVARLLFDGVPAMRGKGDVLISQAFGRLKASGRPRVSMGVTARMGLIDLTVSAEDLPLSELHALLLRYRRGKRYYRLRSGAFIDLSGLDLSRADMLVDELGITAAELGEGRVSVAPYKAFLLDALLDDGERDDAFDRYVEHFRNVDLTAFEPPAQLAERLRPYQTEGFRWLSALADMGFGGILADEMGLGKSVQLIAWLLARRACGRSLIVCPASLVYNWQAEFEKFAPDMDVAVVAGSADERRRVRGERGHEVLITSYDLVRRDVEDYAAMSFNCMALDEAQYIKNRETLAARAVKTIDATHRFALTGTPIENRLAELWSIFDFLMPGLLGSYERFAERYEQPIVGGDADAEERLRAVVGPFVLRRRKEEVLADLPDKFEQVVVAHMGDEQRRLYAAHEQELRLTLTAESDAAFRASKLQVLAELMRLRQLCCDPRLVYEDYDGGSCKLATIIELVEMAISSQRKVLVFSQFTSYLAIIASALAQRGVAYYQLTGSTPKRRRVEMANAFNVDDTPVFLVSLKAGGTGLNLVGASVVVHADPWWNAAAQDQATDRAHRIGQSHDVSVYKVIVKNTIEERILLLQETKADLAERIMGEGAGATSLAALRKEDLIELLYDRDA